MLSLITCTTPNEPGLMFSTRRGLEELACASSTTEPATAASRMTLLVTLSSAVRLYVPGARTMRPTAALASALSRLATVLTAATPGSSGGGGGGDGGDGGEGGEGGGEGGGGTGQVETVPETSVRVVGQEQTVPIETKTLLGPWVGSRG
jgi:hypothetical protein